MSGDEERLISGDNFERGDTALRPTTLDEFIGQGNGRANLETFIHAARNRGDAMDHTLLHGPPGLGKTTSRKSFQQSLVSAFGPPPAR